MSKWPAKAELSFSHLADDFVRITATRRSKKGTETWLHAFALLRPEGVVLFEGPDRAPFYEEHERFFDDHGGLALMVLTHDGQASTGHVRALEHWGAPVMLDSRDHAKARADGLGDAVLVETATAPDWGFRSMHLPGHSPGFTAFEVEAGDARHLIASHFLRQSGADGWTTLISPFLVTEALASLDQLRGLDVDFLLPEGTNREPSPPIPFGPDERDHVVDRALAYLRRLKARHS